ncbi:hypothetical protein [Pseudodesulfovibrio sp. zrk46]|uniref:hypothetical protein n=1 Tax=Pseudodesulfovibrio sp. zrk46 TaxID=2725288 RepID=UPI001449526D|nr:hypothetical protein [Pseudodesulfovibrio sp. zrk46]QJB58000.1 hypothetical protein HFN16_17110 [Pseudodesulfovibrio sp. zrk46]
MLIPIAIFIIIGVGFFLAVNRISTQRNVELNRLENKKRSQYERYQFMLQQRSLLRKEVDDKERKLTTLRNNEQGGIRTVSTSDLNIDEIDDNEKVSRYLIQQGKITMEQNEKVLQKMGVMQMDYLGTCLALGFIDLKTAKQAIKVNKIASKSIIK